MRYLDMDPGSSNGQPATPWTSGAASNPWSCLGATGEWQKQTSVAVVSTLPHQHFATVAVFGPQKVVVVYDGAEGVHDHQSFWKVGGDRSAIGLTKDLVESVDGAVRLGPSTRLRYQGGHIRMDTCPE